MHSSLANMCFSFLLTAFLHPLTPRHTSAVLLKQLQDLRLYQTIYVACHQNLSIARSKSIQIKLVHRDRVKKDS
ncbi:hypothetical protein C7974DRAFT_398491 [Boeremia exigua]|uniref:uncharacterized protein n=1 Tax=Boeremia exigua TaxID=749465 RepID=UPI001E8EDCAC|nr:uncharacterized protein C7974DRAFT_398491 [Boeremia exigua]KAH6619931.1 hypothetical protein C7974DRAFT_398491 [Boeremia exigua]